MSTANDTPTTVTTPTDGAPAPTDSYAEFSSVFDSLITPEGQQDDQQTPQQTDPSDHTAGAENNAQQPIEQADGGDNSGEPAPTGTDTAAGDGQGVQDGAGNDPAGGGQNSTDDLKAQLAALEAKLTALQAAPPAAAPPAAAPAAEPEPARPIYSTEEQAELESLQKEWPELSRMFALMARQVQHETLTYAFNEMERVLTPIQSSVGTIAGNEHMAAIYEVHADYDQVYQPVMEWVEKQPSFLKAAYQNVIKQGTADDVNTMIQRFKEETKWQAPAAGTGVTQPAAPAAPPAQPKAELSDAAKKAATAIGAVGTKRSSPPAAKDPFDFDGGWAEATASK